MSHYITKHKEHEERRASWTERHEYWKHNQVHRHSANEMDTSRHQIRDALDS